MMESFSLIKEPFIGLKFFSEEDSKYFFGRDKQVRVITNAFSLQKITILYGESGVGKSSIIGGGIIPHLKEQSDINSTDDGGPSALIVYLRDWASYSDPFEWIFTTIRLELGRLSENDQSAFPEVSTFRNCNDCISAWLKIACNTNPVEIYIILDQFEEYLAGERNPPDKDKFIQSLSHLTRIEDLPVHIMIAIRSDSFYRLSQLEQVIPAILQKTIELQPFDYEAARTAILKPIREYNVRNICYQSIQQYDITVFSAPRGQGKTSILHDMKKAVDTKQKSKGLESTPSPQHYQVVIYCDMQKQAEDSLTDLVDKIEFEFSRHIPEKDSLSSQSNISAQLDSMLNQFNAPKGYNTVPIIYLLLDHFEEVLQISDKQDGVSPYEFGLVWQQIIDILSSQRYSLHVLLSIRSNYPEQLKLFLQQKWILKQINTCYLHLQTRHSNSGNNIETNLILQDPDRIPFVDIEKPLVDNILSDLNFYGSTDLNLSSSPSSQQEALSPAALQLVMEYLWKLDVHGQPANTNPILKHKTYQQEAYSGEQKNQSPQQLKTPAEKIFELYLNKQLQSFSPDQQYALSIFLPKLVSRGGTKIAFPVFDLLDDTKLNRDDLMDLLKEMDDKRLLRTNTPRKALEPYYEIFHDLLASPILIWLEEYNHEEQKRKNKEILNQKNIELRKEKDARKNIEMLRQKDIELQKARDAAREVEVQRNESEIKRKYRLIITIISIVFIMAIGYREQSKLTRMDAALNDSPKLYDLQPPQGQLVALYKMLRHKPIFRQFMTSNNNYQNQLATMLKGMIEVATIDSINPCNSSQSAQPQSAPSAWLNTYSNNPIKFTEGRDIYAVCTNGRFHHIKGNNNFIFDSNQYSIDLGKQLQSHHQLPSDNPFGYVKFDRQSDSFVTLSHSRTDSNGEQAEFIAFLSFWTIQNHQPKLKWSKQIDLASRGSEKYIEEIYFSPAQDILVSDTKSGLVSRDITTGKVLYTLPQRRKQLSHSGSYRFGSVTSDLIQINTQNQLVMLEEDRDGSPVIIRKSLVGVADFETIPISLSNRTTSPFDQRKGSSVSRSVLPPSRYIFAYHAKNPQTNYIAYSQSGRRDQQKSTNLIRLLRHTENSYSPYGSPIDLDKISNQCISSTMERREDNSSSAPVRQLKFSPKGDKLLILLENGSLYIHGIPQPSTPDSSKPYCIEIANRDIANLLSLSFSEDEEFMLADYTKQDISIWNIGKQPFILKRAQTNSNSNNQILRSEIDNMDKHRDNLIPIACNWLKPYNKYNATLSLARLAAQNTMRSTQEGRKFVWPEYCNKDPD
jgi:hypothetical protein